MLLCEGYCYWRPIAGREPNQYDFREIIVFCSDGNVAVEVFEAIEPNVTSIEELSANEAELKKQITQGVALDINIGRGQYAMVGKNISFTVCYEDGSVTYSGEITANGMTLSFLSDLVAQKGQSSSGLQYLVARIH